MRSATIALALAVVVGVGGVIVQGANSQRSEPQSLFVPPIHPVASVPPGGEACQAPVWLEKEFSQVVFTPDRPNEPKYWAWPRSPLSAEVSDLDSGKLLAQGSLPADHKPGGSRVMTLSARVPGERPLKVCFHNDGGDRVIIWGSTLLHEGTTNPYVAGVRRTDSDATVNGKRIPGDLYLDFARAGDGLTTLLAQIPDAMERAARFKSPWMGGWTFWLLFALLATVGPFMLIRALRGLGQPEVTEAPSAERSPAST